MKLISLIISLNFIIATQPVFAALINICDRGKIGEEIVRVIGSSGSGIDRNINCRSVPSEKMKKIQGLNLHNKELTFIPPNAFSGLDSLILLDLSNNHLSIIPADVFEGLSSLMELDLSGNKIDVLGIGVFSQLTSLKILDLRENNLNTIERSIYGLNEETKIFGVETSAPDLIDICNRGDIGSAIAKATESYDCSKVSRSKMSSLKELSLNGQEIKAISEKSFMGLTSLTFLDLSYNEIKIIPKNTFSGLPKLRYLYLNDNKISSIAPNVFLNLTNLATINLQVNPLIKISKNELRISESVELEIDSNVEVTD